MKQNVIRKDNFQKGCGLRIKITPLVYNTIDKNSIREVIDLILATTKHDTSISNQGQEKGGITQLNQVNYLWKITQDNKLIVSLENDIL